MTWIDAARGPFDRLLDAEAESGRQAVRARLEGLRLAFLDLPGRERPLAESLEAARTKGPWVLWMLRGAMSPASFRSIRAAWNQGDCLETAALEELAAREAGAQLRGFFDFWVYGAALPEYRLRRAEVRETGGEWDLTLHLDNRGSGPYPIPVVVQSEEGARHELAAAAPVGGRAELRCRLLTRPVKAAADPDGDVLMSCGERVWVNVSASRAKKLSKLSKLSKLNKLRKLRKFWPF